MEICMGVKKCYESHGCVSVHQNIWMTVNPTAVPPSWLEDMADWRSSQSANKNWVTHTDGQPTVLLNAYQEDELLGRTWNGLRCGKSRTKKIKFASFALQWTGLSGEKQDTAMLQGLVALQVPYNQSIMHSAMLNLIAYAFPSDASGVCTIYSLFALQFMLS